MEENKILKIQSILLKDIVIWHFLYLSEVFSQIADIANCMIVSKTVMVILSYQKIDWI